MGKNRNKLRYVKGTCELERGIVSFIGGMSGVSEAQTWYHIIYAIKDKFPEIDFWIDPKLDCCETLPSTANYLRYTTCKNFNCSYEEFPNGEIRPKRKLSDLDKRKYKENRDKVDLGVNIEFVPVLPSMSKAEKVLRDDLKTIKDTLGGFDLHILDELKIVNSSVQKHEKLIDYVDVFSYVDLLEGYKEINNLCVNAIEELKDSTYYYHHLNCVMDIGLHSLKCLKKLEGLCTA